MWHPCKAIFAALALSFLLLTACKPNCKPVVTLAAASLARVLTDLEEQFELEHKDLDLQLEISGSQTACRKVSELHRHADLVLSADHQVIDRLLVKTGNARYTIRFATNEVVLVHMAHSRHTEAITADNWPEILLRPKVRLGLVDPDQAPIGYRTLLVWKLAALEDKDKLAGASADLVTRLRAHVAKEHIVPHEGELLQLLQTRTIDYAFVYRSSAEEHNLKLITLPDRYNLGAADQVKRYARAEVTVRLARQERQQITGAPVVYGLTIPDKAENPRGGEAAAAFLLGRQGQRILKRSGFRPLAPARCTARGKRPAALRSLTR